MKNWLSKLLAPTDEQMKTYLDLLSRNREQAEALIDKEQIRAYEAFMRLMNNSSNIVLDNHSPRLDIAEGQTIEMKSSIIFSPETHRPDSSQPFNIAREIAAFMNADGGDLYLGVNNDGYVIGIGHDFGVLNDAVVNGFHGSDEMYAKYKPTNDGYRQKIENIVCMMLGKFAASLVSLEFLNEGNVEFVKLHIEPSRSKFIFLGENQGVYVRLGQSSRLLVGQDLEDYREKRFQTT